MKAFSFTVILFSVLVNSSKLLKMEGFTKEKVVGDVMESMPHDLLNVRLLFDIIYYPSCLGKQHTKGKTV